MIDGRGGRNVPEVRGSVFLMTVWVDRKGFANSGIEESMVGSGLEAAVVAAS